MKEPIRSDSQDEGALPADFGCAQPVGLTHNPITKQHPWLPCNLTWMLSLFALPKGHFGDGTWERVLFIYLFIYLFKQFLLLKQTFAFIVIWITAELE